MKGVGQFLRELYDKKGMEGVLLVSANGMIISSVLPKKLRFNRISEIQWLKETVSSVAEQVKRGSLERVLFDLGVSKILFTRVGRGALLVSIAKSESDVSVITLYSKVTAEVVEAILQNRRVTDEFLEDIKQEAIERLKGVVMDAFITEQYGIDMEEFG